MLRSDARTLQQAWGCRRAGCKPEDSPEQAPKRAEVTRAVCSVLHVPEGEAAEVFRGQCPRATLYEPHMVEVARLHRWWKARQLALYVPFPSEAMLDAIDAVEDGVRDYEAEMIEAAKRKAKGRGAERDPRDPRDPRAR